MSDVVIVGGGVIGLSIAWELAGAGLCVSLLDQVEIAQETSWAGAGMIPPGDLLDTATHQLAALSAQCWPEISAALRNETGLHNGYSRCGGILLADHRSVPELATAWSRLHVTTDILNSVRLTAHEPLINTEIPAAVWLPEMAQVRNPRHVKALQAACQSRGVQFHPGERVVRWEKIGNRVQAAVTERSRFPAAEFVIATGAWTSQLLAPLQLHVPIEPVHGQIVLLRSPMQLFRRVIEQGARYLVPRDDGRILIGATEERIGFEKRNTPEVVAELLKFARGVIPALAELPIEKTWSGLRPWCGHGRPYIGRVEDYPNLFLSAGHFRAGISNSPGTALVMRQLILGEPPAIDLSRFTLESQIERIW